MKVFRYRRPSVNALLGITRAKRRVNRSAGITAAFKPFRAPGNLLRTANRRTYYYPISRTLKSQIPTPFGLWRSGPLPPSGSPRRGRGGRRGGIDASFPAHSRSRLPQPDYTELDPGPLDPVVERIGNWAITLL